MIGNKINGLGEIFLRVNDMELMKNLYRKTKGFEILNKFDNYTFFKIADSDGGHTQTLKLFEIENPTAFNKGLKGVK